LAAGADEVSAAISQMFGAYGQEFQALSAQAAAFHDQFVGLMSSGAAAYLSTEVANAEQVLMGAMNAPGQGGGAAASVGASFAGQVQAEAQAMMNAIPGAAAAIQGLNSFGATVAAPYQALVANTATNLGAINSTFMAHPFPFLNQVASNQVGFAHTFGAGVATSLQGFPANVPANIQLAIQGASTFNPGPALQQFVSGNIGAAQTITTSLQNAGQDINAGMPTLQAGFQAAFRDLFAGNPIGAYGDLNRAFVSALLPSFHGTQVPGGTIFGDFLVTPAGPLAALAPALNLPGQMAQNFVNMLPPGSIPAQMAQHGANVVAALTNFNTSLDILSLTTADLSFGAPVQLIASMIGAPASALSALNSTGVAFTGAVQAGNASAAAAALLDAPAFVTNGFLNGTTTITLPSTSLTILGVIPVTSTVTLPLGGLLTPLSFPHATANSILGTMPVDIVGGTPVGGLIPSLMSIGSQLAHAITPIT
jgi:hypothetical protein